MQVKNSGFGIGRRPGAMAVRLFKPLTGTKVRFFEIFVFTALTFMGK